MSDKRDRELPRGRLNDLRLTWAGAKWRARLRYEIGVLRYRLAIRIGGGAWREDLDELHALRSQLAAIRELRAYRARSSQAPVYDYVQGVDLDRILTPGDFE